MENKIIFSFYKRMNCCNIKITGKQISEEVLKVIPMEARYFVKAEGISLKKEDAKRYYDSDGTECYYNSAIIHFKDLEKMDKWMRMVLEKKEESDLGEILQDLPIFPYDVYMGYDSEAYLVNPDEALDELKRLAWGIKKLPAENHAVINAILAEINRMESK